MIALAGAIFGGAPAAWCMVIGVGGASVFAVVYSYVVFQNIATDK